jgi:hypothetical protein
VGLYPGANPGRKGKYKEGTSDKYRWLKETNYMNTTMIQSIIWIAAGAALVMLLMRRRNRKVTR